MNDMLIVMVTGHVDTCVDVDMYVCGYECVDVDVNAEMYGDVHMHMNVDTDVNAYMNADVYDDMDMNMGVNVMLVWSLL